MMGHYLKILIDYDINCFVFEPSKNVALLNFQSKFKKLNKFFCFKNKLLNLKNI